PHVLPGLVGQRVGNRLGKGRMVVRRVVVDEQDLVVRIGHHLGQRIEADRRTLVQVIAVGVVAAVDDDGEHQLSPTGYRPSALRAAAYSIIEGGAVSTTSLKRSSWNSASMRRPSVVAASSTVSAVALPACSENKGAGQPPNGTATSSAGRPSRFSAVRR